MIMVVVVRMVVVVVVRTWWWWWLAHLSTPGVCTSGLGGGGAGTQGGLLEEGGERDIGKKKYPRIEAHRILKLDMTLPLFSFPRNSCILTHFIGQKGILKKFLFFFSRMQEPT